MYTRTENNYTKPFSFFHIDIEKEIAFTVFSQWGDIWGYIGNVLNTKKTVRDIGSARARFGTARFDLK